MKRLLIPLVLFIFASSVSAAELGKRGKKEYMGACGESEAGLIYAMTNGSNAASCDAAQAVGTERIYCSCAPDGVGGYEWVLLDDALGGGGAGVTDGDKGDVVVSGSGATWTVESGTATTAGALAANGANCSAGSYPLGVSAAGAAESCTVAATGTIGGSTGATDNAILRADGAGGVTAQSSAVTIADTTGNLQWEGTTADDFEGNFTFADPTADWTWDWSPTGQSIAPSGTTSLPSYSFAGDPNTGIYSDTADTLKFSVGGNRRLYLNNSGFYSSVGIFGSALSGNYLEGFLRHVLLSTAGSGAPRVTQDYESQYLFTNEGSTAENYHLLPSSISNTLTFPLTYCAQDADGIRVVAAAGDTIRVIDKVTATGGYVSSTTIGSCINLQSINATEWFTTGVVGVWTDGTFTYDDTSLTTP